MSTSSTHPVQLYKILHLPTLSLLTFDTDSECVVLVSPAKYPSEDKTTVLRRVYNISDPQHPIWGMSLWRLDEAKWGPENGVYTISQDPSSSSTLLTIPNFIDTQRRIPPSDPAEVKIVQKETEMPETQWWRITSKVSVEGYVYQEVVNYRSGHVINVSVTARNNVAAVKGQRLGVVTESG